MTLRPCSCALPPPVRRRAVTAVLALLLATAALYAYCVPVRRPCANCLSDWTAPLLSPSASSSRPKPEPLSLAELDELPSIPTPPPGVHAGFCAQRFSGAYLDQLRDHAIQYCEAATPGAPAPSSELTCFHTRARDDTAVDSFCVGTGARWDAARQTFRLDCPVRRRPDVNETAAGLIAFESIIPYWFNTGPRRVFDTYVEWAEAREDVELARRRTEDEAPIVLLVRREGNNNLWHSLMEIWSMMLSMDVLRTARRDGGHGAPFLRLPDDLARVRVVMVDDDMAREPTFDLWRVFSPHATTQLSAQPPPAFLQGPVTIVAPLAGGSNPLWQNDWVVRDCTAADAPLLRLFVQRVFAFYDVPRQSGPAVPTVAAADPPGSEPAAAEAPPLVVTFIVRTGTRRLLGHEALLEQLRARYADAAVTVQAVDLAVLPLAEQLRRVQATDVLVGVHGAGLTHTMFMRAGAGAVVEIQPAGLAHRGFRNLAALTGQRYFSAHAEMVLPEEVEALEAGGEPADGDADKPWQSSHVRIEADRFLALMDVAIKSLYNEGLRSADVA